MWKYFPFFLWKLMFLRQSVANYNWTSDCIQLNLQNIDIQTYFNFAAVFDNFSYSIKNLNSDKRQLVSQTLSLKNFSEKNCHWENCIYELWSCEIGWHLYISMWARGEKIGWSSLSETKLKYDLQTFALFVFCSILKV